MIIFRFMLYSMAGCLLAIPWPALAQTNDAWTELGTIFPAAAQPTTWGREIHALCPWNGKVYMGYGDWNHNTGPIVITSYDPLTRTFANAWTSRTESIDVFRPLMGSLYVPAIDPVRTRDPVFSVCDPVGNWSDGRIYMPGGETITHAYDMATLTGTDLWLIGSSERDTRAVALRSLDGGATWGKSLELSNHPEINRFYFAGVINNKLYLQGSHDTNSMAFDGASWTQSPRLPYSNTQHTELFLGKMLLLVQKRMFTFDGEIIQWAVGRDRPVRAFCVSEKTLYVLDEKRMRIRATRDFYTWSTISTAPSNTTSIAVLNGKLYAGTADSKLYEYNQALPAEVPTDNNETNTGEQAGPAYPPQGVGSADP